MKIYANYILRSPLKLLSPFSHGAISAPTPLRRRVKRIYVKGTLLVVWGK